MRTLRKLGDREGARSLQEVICRQIGYNVLKPSRLKKPRTRGMLAGFCITKKGIKPHVLSYDVCLGVRAGPVAGMRMTDHEKDLEMVLCAGNCGSRNANEDRRFHVAGSAASGVGRSVGRQGRRGLS